MRISIKISDRQYVRPALVQDEMNSVDYLATKVADPDVVLEHIEEMAEEFVVINFGQPIYDEDDFKECPYVIPERKFRDYQAQAERALVEAINDIREPYGGLPQIPTDEPDA